MKENSIEEDIELLQDETSSLGLFFKCKCSEKYKIALEHILSDYKRVLKENEELKLYNNSITSQLEQMTTEKFKNGWFHQSEFKDSIPVQTVKDKIEELKQEKKKYGNCLIEMYEDELVNRDIKILQELLEGRK